MYQTSGITPAVGTPQDSTAVFLLPNTGKHTKQGKGIP
jgi:hypothetical protein